MKPETAEGLERLRRLAEDHDPRGTVLAALAHDPRAMQAAIEISKTLEKGWRDGMQASSLLILAMASIGFFHGAVIDVRNEGAGQATDHFTEVLIKVFRFAVEGGFADTMKEMNNAPPSRD